MSKIIDFKKYTSICIGGKHKVKIINNIDDYNMYTIIGRGNNILLSNKPPLMAILGDEFDYILHKNNQLIVGASVSSGKLLTYCRKNNIANFEFMAKLPGNIGGLVKMNAGLKQYEIFNYLKSIKTQYGVFDKKDIQHTYRSTTIDGIIYEATFDIEQGFSKEKQEMFIEMRNNQPSTPSAGSCFKNPKNNHSAGYLIEKVGLRGYRIGNMSFSSVHSNFLVNLGNGTYDEAVKLIKLAQDKVHNEFNIELKLEIKII